MTTVYNATAERLQSYYGFDQYIIDETAHVASMQSRMDYGQFMERFEIPEPQTIVQPGAKPIRVLDIIPRRDYDETTARVMHLAMGNDLDDNQIYQIATTFAVDPGIRTIAFANPSSPGHKTGILSLRDCVRVARGDNRPLIDRQSRYVTSQGIVHTIQEGFSYGSLPALKTTQFAEKYDQNVLRATTIEPADVKPRNRHKLAAMIGLGVDFVSTGKALPGYVEATGVDAYTKEARHDTVLGLIGYGAGLARVSNLVVASALAGDYFYHRAFTALRAQEGAHLSVIWGSESELVDTMHMRDEIDALAWLFPRRVSGMEIPSAKHNMVNDIHLQAALLMQARSDDVFRPDAPSS